MEPTVDAPMIMEPSLGVHPGNTSQTEIKVEKVNHSWTVKNFSHCYQEYLENFVYLARGDETLTWSIKIYPKGNGENNKDFVFLCLNKVNNGGKSKIGFKSRFMLRTAELKEIEMRIHPNPSHSDYVSYIKRDVLFPQIMPRDMIIVNVEIDVAVETVTTTSEAVMGPSHCEKQLVEDYQRLFRDDVLTDFTICVGDQEIRVHKAILAARSPVFAAMLTHTDTDEVKNGVMHIKDLDYEVVREMICYIYSGHCEKDINEIASELLVAADKYRLEELKNYCEHNLVENLTPDTACELLVLGDMHCAPRLRQRAVQLILQRPKYITNTSGWDAILRSHPDLVTDIVNHFDKAVPSAFDPSSSAIPPCNLSSSTGPMGSI